MGRVGGACQAGITGGCGDTSRDIWTVSVGAVFADMGNLLIESAIVVRITIGDITEKLARDAFTSRPAASIGNPLASALRALIAQEIVVAGQRDTRIVASIDIRMPFASRVRADRLGKVIRALHIRPRVVALVGVIVPRASRARAQGCGVIHTAWHDGTGIANVHVHIPMARCILHAVALGVQVLAVLVAANAAGMRVRLLKEAPAERALGAAGVGRTSGAGIGRRWGGRRSCAVCVIGAVDTHVIGGFPCTVSRMRAQINIEITLARHRLVLGPAHVHGGRVPQTAGGVTCFHSAAQGAGWCFAFIQTIGASPLASTRGAIILLEVQIAWDRRTRGKTHVEVGGPGAVTLRRAAGLGEVVVARGNGAFDDAALNVGIKYTAHIGRAVSLAEVVAGRRQGLVNTEADALHHFAVPDAQRGHTRILVTGNGYAWGLAVRDFAVPGAPGFLVAIDFGKVFRAGNLPAGGVDAGRGILRDVPTASLRDQRQILTLLLRNIFGAWISRIWAGNRNLTDYRGPETRGNQEGHKRDHSFDTHGG